MSLTLQEIRALSTKVVVQDVRYDLQSEQLNTLREQFVEDSIELQEKVDAFSDVKKTHQDTVKEIKLSMQEKLRQLSKGYELRKDIRTYEVPNYESNTMDYYDEQGTLVHSRRLRSEERPQISIHHLKTA